MVNRTALPAGTPLGTVQRRFRGPFARWPRAADGVLAVVVLAAMVFLEQGPGDSMVVRSIGDVPVHYLLAFLVAGPALYWRRTEPLVVLGTVLAAWVVTLGTDEADVGFAAIIALYSAGRYGAENWLNHGEVAAAIVVVNIDAIYDPAPWAEVAIFGSLVLSGAWYVGRRMRARAERATQRLLAQAAETRRIVTEERTRIARELHDVVAHRVSLMTVQAAAAKAVAAHDLAGAMRAMGAVEEVGRQALDELRHLLGVLRPEEDPQGLGPQPRLADLPKLIEQIREAGVVVDLADESEPAELPARVDLFAYRIVQEALTNVLKHAGPGTYAEVRLSTRKRGIVIEVRDEGITALSGVAADEVGSRGHGIVGMRERALLLGGTLEARPRHGGGFQVVAHLPIGGEPT